MPESLINSVIESLHTHSLAFFICAIASVVVVGISKSGFGAGLGVLSLPLMASQSTLNEALAILLPLLIAIDLVGIRRFLKNANWRILKLILPAAFVGMFLGMIFFTVITPKALTLFVGVFIMLFLIQMLVTSHFDLRDAKPYPWLGRLMAITSGFTSFVAHNGGPPITIFMLRENLLPMVYTSTLGVFFAFINLGKLGPYAYLDLLHFKQLATSAILLPCVPVGVYLGFYLAEKISVKWYYRIVQFFLLVASVKLIADGLM